MDSNSDSPSSVTSKATSSQNCSENIVHFIRSKYITKIEDLTLKYEENINSLRVEFATQIEDLETIISEMSQRLVNTKDICSNKIKDLIDVVCEKDVEIQELEDKVDQMYSSLTNDSHGKK